MKFFNRRSLIAAAMCATTGMLAPQSANAAGDPIHIVVPYGSGGMIDALVRMVGEHMAVELGQPVVVDNKPGANGIIGSSFVAAAKPDGLTILSGGTGPVSLNTMLRKNLPYSLDSFEPVAMLFDGPLSVTVPSTMKVNSIKEFVEYGNKKGEPVSYGTMGPGSVTHLFGLLLGQQTGHKMRDVAYRNNSSSLVDLIAGQVDLSFATPISLLKHMKAGDVKVLALTTKERSDKFPEIPTLVEQGYPNLVASFWTGFLAPKGTPKATVDRIAKAAVNAMNDPKISGFLTARGMHPNAGGPQAMADQLADDVKVWGETIKNNNLSLE